MNFSHFRPSLFAVLVLAISCAREPHDEKTKSDLIGRTFGDAGKLEFLPAFSAANLEWQSKPAGETEWETAKSYCASLSLAGGGWRLPSKDELLALYGAKTSSAPLARYPGMLSHAYWSSSPYAGNTAGAWYVEFGFGDTYNVGVDNYLAVRCVR